jgi:hypothetical protein
MDAGQIEERARWLGDVRPAALTLAEPARDRRDQAAEELVRGDI